MWLYQTIIEYNCEKECLGGIDRMIVRITRQLSGNKQVGEIEADLISSPEWNDTSGGYRKKSGAYTLFGYIDYKDAIGLVDCSGEHNFGNNSAKVCISYSLNREKKYQEGYQYLMEHASNQKPESKISCNRPDGWGPCTKHILYILEKQGDITRRELREMIGCDDSTGKVGYQLFTIRQALKRLEKRNRIKISKNSNYNKQIISKL